MTEIKFRAWDEEENKMYDVIAIHFHDNNLDVELQIKEAGKYKHKELSYQKEHIMQNAGLKDKNGKEIYEGDIVSYSTKVKENGKVQFNQDRSRFEVFWKFGDVVGFDKHWTENELEIIGNIYENPELLER